MTMSIGFISVLLRVYSCYNIVGLNFLAAILWHVHVLTAYGHDMP